jgi:site-specific recombinase XerD
VGIRGRPTAPTLAGFAERFDTEIATVCAEKPKTVAFYQEKLRRLLEDSAISAARLDEIDEAMIDAYKQRRTRQPSRYGRPVSPASVNRELATLRRILRLAQAWKLIDRTPRIRLLRGDKHREFVLTEEQEKAYLDACTAPWWILLCCCSIPDCALERR